MAGFGLAGALVFGLTILVTWPQGRELSTAFAAHADAYFSTWRLMWIAHALRADPGHLFDTNVFHPATGTLAFSDATLLQGLIATPFLIAGVSPILVYNVLLLVGFVGSGLAMFVLVRHLTERTGAAIVAAVVFTMAPYRIEHFMHLELQWTMFMPLTYWAIHRAIAERSWSFGVLSGVCLWLQFLSCIYYGVFLSLTVAVLVPLLVLQSPREGRRALPALVVGGLIGAALTVPYALPYVENARTLGSRHVEELLQYSAEPTTYLATSYESRLWGWTADRWGSPERRAFPGLLALLLAAWGLTSRSLRQCWIYGVLALFSVEMSFGLHGTVYTWLFEHVEGLRGLRAPARFAILAQCAIAVLAGFGLRDVQDRWSARASGGLLSAPLILTLLLAAEYSNRPLALEPVRPPDPATPDVYRMIRTLGPGVVLELPLPTLSSLPGREATYAFWSAAHWNKLVNGYSGYFPQVYAETLNVMEAFPDTASVARLTRLDVRYIVVHHAFVEDDRRERLLRAMGADAALERVGMFRDAVGPATLFVLRKTRPSAPSR
jgi:hypothetical protein